MNSYAYIIEVLAKPLISGIRCTGRLHSISTRIEQPLRSDGTYKRTMTSRRPAAQATEPQYPVLGWILPDQDVDNIPLRLLRQIVGQMKIYFLRQSRGNSGSVTSRNELMNRIIVEIRFRENHGRYTGVSLEIAPREGEFYGHTNREHVGRLQMGMLRIAPVVEGQIWDPANRICRVGIRPGQRPTLSHLLEDMLSCEDLHQFSFACHAGGVKRGQRDWWMQYFARLARYSVVSQRVRLHKSTDPPFDGYRDIFSILSQRWISDPPGRGITVEIEHGFFESAARYPVHDMIVVEEDSSGSSTEKEQ